MENVDVMFAVSIQLHKISGIVADSHVALLEGYILGSTREVESLHRVLVSKRCSGFCWVLEHSEATTR